MIRVITFDLDDTLWPIGPVIVRAETVLQQWLEVHYPRIADRFGMAGLRQLRQQVVVEQPELLHDVTALRLASLQRAAAACGYQVEMADQAFSVLWEQRNRVEFFTDVMPALEQLAAEYVLGAIPHGNADLGPVGLDHLFQFIVRASEVGCSKPELAPFQIAAKLSGHPPEAIVHVGDDLHTDMVGARRAGMRGIWVNRSRQQRDDGVAVDGEIQTLAEIHQLLQGWSS